jgi:hypothetical protein
MKCADWAMSAMSYHRHYRNAVIAEAYWQFVSEWQTGKGELHRVGGQWFLLELASRFSFASVLRILEKSFPLAVARQKKDGGFDPLYPAGSACEVILAYSRHQMLDTLLKELKYDPRTLIKRARTPLSLKTRREALFDPDPKLARAVSEKILRKQLPNGSWTNLITATAHAIHGLLDCGLSPKDERVSRACDWLCSCQRPIDKALFPCAPDFPFEGMFYTDRTRREIAFERRCHPEYRWRRPEVECMQILPTYQTGAALSTLCRCGYISKDEVKKGFEYFLTTRGPGGVNYTHHWCNCAVGRWLKKDISQFG